ncbi:MAG: hypothetical protein ACE5LB_01380 [Acidiferrobacterales bacterium]
MLLTVATIMAAEPANPEEPPDLELLEFLGTWETSTGEWLDPTSFSDEESLPLEPQREEKDE